MSIIDIPNDQEFHKGIEAFRVNEHRGYIYFDALNHILQNWDNPGEMARGVEMLLHSWHQNFYRFGDFDFEQLVECLKINLKRADNFRGRNISSLSKNDEKEIEDLFSQLLDALRGGNRKSPVAVAKTLHLLAPNFFPLWDTEIAKAFGSWWVFSDFGVSEYIQFIWKMRAISKEVSNYKCFSNPNPDRSLLKMLDEYYYAKYTGEWI